MFLTHPPSYNIILATRSPRRNMLLSGLDIPFEVVLKEDVEEVYPDNLSPQEIALFLARLKSAPFAPEIADGKHLVITADTIVCLDGRILGKPKDENDAFDMLRSLSGKMHTVVTGVCLSTAQKTICFSDETKVWFRDLSDEEIAFYLNSYKPYDKAGAYGAQEWIGYAAILRIEGSYFNVMGLPVHRLYDELRNF